jgi:hypothetical protein
MSADLHLLYVAALPAQIKKRPSNGVIAVRRQLCFNREKKKENCAYDKREDNVSIFYGLKK